MDVSRIAKTKAVHRSFGCKSLHDAVRFHGLAVGREPDLDEPPVGIDPDPAVGGFLDGLKRSRLRFPPEKVIKAFAKRFEIFAGEQIPQGQKLIGCAEFVFV